MSENDSPERRQDDLILVCAAIAHEVNRAFCESLNEVQLPWAKVQPEIVDSVVAGVKAVLDNPEITPAELHAKWSAFKLEQGWTLGSTRDVEKKTHPNLVPYDMLPHSQRTKDALFRAVVRTFFGL